VNYKTVEENLRVDEGEKHDVYLDTAMNPTVGIGHKIRPNEVLKLGDTITGEQIIDFFRHDLLHAEIGARNSLKRFEELPSEIQNVLVEMCFNLGTAGLRKFKKMLNAADNFDWAMMADELLDSKAARDLPKRYIKYANRIKGV